MTNYLEIPKEKLVKLNELNNAVKGTPQYTRYLMETCTPRESDPKRWLFVGWGVPNEYRPATYRKSGANIYIYQGDYRYTVANNADVFNTLFN